MEYPLEVMISHGPEADLKIAWRVDSTGVDVGGAGACAETRPENAIQAALTGHLVLSTLHTNDAVSSITRLIDLGVEPFLINATLVGVIAQRLVRRICPNCMESVVLGQDELKSLGIGLEQEGQIELKRGNGCCKL